MADSLEASVRCSGQEALATRAAAPAGGAGTGAVAGRASRPVADVALGPAVWPAPEVAVEPAVWPAPEVAVAPAAGACGAAGAAACFCSATLAFSHAAKSALERASTTIGMKP